MAKAKKLPSGTWRCIASYTDENGKYKQKSFTAPTKNEAEYLAKEFVVDYHHKSKPENKTLGEVADEYITNRENLLSPATIAGYKKIRRTALQTIIDVRLGLLTKETYQKAINEYSKDRSYKTVINAHMFFHKILKGYGYDVADNVNLPQKEKKELSIPTQEEVDAFLAYIKDSRIYLYVCFAVYLGLRKSEIIALTWGDIDLKNKRVTVNKARVKNEYNEFVEKSPKTYSSTRTLKLPPVLEEILPEPGKNSERIFVDSPSALESLYKRMCDKADFHYNFHSLRHYYASVLLRVGMPNRYAKERMGHATENMLKEVYQHVFKDKQEEFDAALEDYFKNVE